jgi:DNA-binding response OmpR family regulator
MAAKRQGKILLVEDEKLLRGLIAHFLRSEGYEVLEACDGREAVHRFEREQPFDLVLLDLELPELPGVEVCRNIRIRCPHQPVIICSAAILDSHVEALRALGVHQYLSKPYHPNELLHRIAIELDRAASCQARERGEQAPADRPQSAHPQHAGPVPPHCSIEPRSRRIDLLSYAPQKEE